MGTRENKVETYFNKMIKRLGGISFKWTGEAGVNDRIGLLPMEEPCPCCGTGAYVIFREIKTVDGTVKPKQVKKIALIKLYGGDVGVVFGHVDVIKLEKELEKRK